MSKISICIPTYNGEQFIESTLRSVLSQDCGDMEIIISDDDSHDRTLDKIRALSDSRISIHINDKPLGLSGNWNKAVSYASGDYIKLMCQDDILCPGALKAQATLLDSHPEAALCIGNTSVINDKGDIVMERKRFKGDGITDGKRFAKRSFRGRNIYSEPPNILMRASAKEKAGAYDEKLSYTPDWDYGVMLSYVGDIAYTSAEVMRFRISDYSETNRLSQEMRREIILDSERLFKKHREMGIIKLGAFDHLIFSLAVRAGAVARDIVLRHKKHG